MNLTRRRYGALAALALCASLATDPARAEIIVLGADYFSTIQPTFFTPLGVLNPLTGLPFGPGNTDTVVHRQADCSLSLGALGSSCTIPIEMVALSLVSTVDPNVRLRESPTSASAGQMTMRSDGTGTGGTFSSFFDVFFELSFDGGSSWIPQAALPLTSSGAAWMAADPVPPEVIVNGLVGDQNANRHTNKARDQFDFRLIGSVTEQHPGQGVHTAVPAGGVIPEPGSLSLVGLALLAASALGRASRRRSTAGDSTSS